MCNLQLIPNTAFCNYNTISINFVIVPGIIIHILEYTKIVLGKIVQKLASIRHILSEILQNSTKTEIILFVFVLYNINII